VPGEGETVARCCAAALPPPSPDRLARSGAPDGPVRELTTTNHAGLIDRVVRLGEQLSHVIVNSGSRE
jgi:hypothetical protein